MRKRGEVPHPGAKRRTDRERGTEPQDGPTQGGRATKGAWEEVEEEEGKNGWGGLDPPGS